MRQGPGWTSTWPLAALALGSALGCSSSNSVTSPVTSLPSSDPVATNAMKFCADTVAYLEQNLSAIAPSNCATGAGLPSVEECEGQYNACIAASSNVDASAVNEGLGVLLAGCNGKLSSCKGVDVGPVAQCIADIVSAEIAASRSINAQSACANGKAPPPPGDPASCASLPTDCRIGL
jgi:hypothetical protein